MYQLNNLKPAPGAKKKRKRIGRGPGSGQGTYAGRGLNGQGSRSGAQTHPWFEGGQMPLYRRIPKRGFFSRNRVENQVVNLGQFERFDAAQEIGVDYLKSCGMVSGRDPRVKILGNGEVNGAFRVKVHAVSDAARRKIEAAGGSVELIPYANEARAAEAAGTTGAKARARARKAGDAE
jgi:large subunit ribosomal protein L15